MDAMINFGAIVCMIAGLYAIGLAVSNDLRGIPCPVPAPLSRRPKR